MASNQGDVRPSPAVALQWVTPRGDWGFINEKGQFVVGNWSPTLTCNAASTALGAINEKLRLEMNQFQNPTQPYGNSWWRQVLANSDYGACDVANPALLGPTKRVRAAAMDVQPVSGQPLLTLIANMVVRAAAPPSVPPPGKPPIKRQKGARALV